MKRGAVVTTGQRQADGSANAPEDRGAECLSTWNWGLCSGQVTVLSRRASGMTPNAAKNRSKRNGGETSGSTVGALPRQLRSTRGAEVHQKKNFLVVRAVVFLLSASLVVQSAVLVLGAVVRPSSRVWSSGPVVCFRPPGLFLSVFSKKRSRPRAPNQGPVFGRGDNPRTDVQAGIPKYVRFTWTWDRLFGNLLLHVPCRFLLRLFLRTPSSRFRPQAGASGRASTYRAGSPWRLLLFTSLSSFLSAGSALKKTWIRSCIQLSRLRMVYASLRESSLPHSEPRFLRRLCCCVQAVDLPFAEARAYLLPTMC